MQNELKPCPFCGAHLTEPSVVTHPNVAWARHHPGDVMDDDCPLSGWGFYEHQLGDAWNRRLSTPSTIVAEPIAASLIRDAIDVGTDEAADDAAGRIWAYARQSLSGGVEPRGCPTPGACSCAPKSNAAIVAETVELVREEARRIQRTCEMSAGIMRDARRTGGWEGAEKTAAQFGRMADRASTILEALLHPAAGEDKIDG